MIAGLPLVFLWLAQQLCPVTPSEIRGGRLQLADAHTPCFQLLETVYAKNYFFDLFAPNPFTSRRADGHVASGAVLRIAAPDAGRSG